ncbi:MAG: hypothetical protein SFZ03_08950 [Candidatus Melainabacteria bacterium]|nr:hypothetical protein [Candidatus Melainabacteria bacterium]
MIVSSSSVPFATRLPVVTAKEKQPVGLLDARLVEGAALQKTHSDGWRQLSSNRFGEQLQPERSQALEPTDTRNAAIAWLRLPNVSALPAPVAASVVNLVTSPPVARLLDNVLPDRPESFSFERLAQWRAYYQRQPEGVGKAYRQWVTEKPAPLIQPPLAGTLLPRLEDRLREMKILGQEITNPTLPKNGQPESVLGLLRSIPRTLQTEKLPALGITPPYVALINRVMATAGLDRYPSVEVTEPNYRIYIPDFHPEQPVYRHIQQTLAAQHDFVPLPRGEGFAFEGIRIDVSAPIVHLSWTPVGSDRFKEQCQEALSTRNPLVRYDDPRYDTHLEPVHEWPNSP